MGEFDRLAKCVGFPPTGQNMDLNSHSSIENLILIVIVQPLSQHS